MAFTVEDGSGLAGANSYVSVADSDTYFTDRNNTTWTGSTDAAKQAALVKATQFVDSMVDFVGTKNSGTQALKWPRTGAYDGDNYLLSSTEVPGRVEDCVCEFANHVISGTDLIDVYTKGVIEERVEGAVSIKYDKSSPDFTRYSDIWAIISDLTIGSAAGGVNVRA